MDEMHSADRGFGQVGPAADELADAAVDDGATEDFASIAADTDGRLGPLLMFHKVPEGKTVKNRVHFDLESAEVLTEADRLTSLGAKQIRSLAENNNRWISFLDPEGNEGSSRPRVDPHRPTGRSPHPLISASI